MAQWARKTTFRQHRAGARGAALLVLAACAGDPSPRLPERHVAGMTPLVTAESEILSGPNDIAIDVDGNIYVLDYLLAQIIVLSPTGERLRTIGRKGKGPGEFQLPRSFTLSGDTLRVVDVGNGKLQVVGLHGDFVRSTPLPPGASMGPMDVDAEGRLLVGTLGLQDALVSYHDARGNQVRTLGTPPAPAPTMLDFTSIKKEILAGTVPAMFRNTALPVFAEDGGAWIVLNGEGQVQRYDSTGALQASAQLVVPEMERIWADVVERTRAIMGDQRRLAGLAYVSDAAVVGHTLWLLLNVPEGDPTVMLALSAAGTAERRVQFADVIGAKYFAIDRRRARIVFVLTANASVVAAPWTEETL